MENKTKKQPVKPAKATPTKAAPKKAVKKEVKQPVVKDEPKKVEVKLEAEQSKPEKAKITLNQELNLLVGLFSLLTIIAFCFAFQGGDMEVSGWEVFLKSGAYSGVFKGLMIAYVIAIFIDCVLTIRVDTNNEILNIVEKVLYAITTIANIIVVAVLLSVIQKVGIGFIIFFIISIVSAIVKMARIYSEK